MSKQNIYDNQTFFSGYIKTRDKTINYNDYLEKPVVQQILAQRNYTHALDLGCGFGTYSIYLANQGTQVTGVDISQKMIAHAKQNNAHPHINYQVATMEDFNYPLSQFDLVLSTLALHYIEDIEFVIKKIAQALVHGGDFIFTIEHPATRAAIDYGWHRNEKGEKLHWKLANYFQRGKREEHWLVDGVVKYHRTISDYFYLLRNNGFVLTEFIEIEPLGEVAELIPESVHRPPFLLIKGKKDLF